MTAEPRTDRAMGALLGGALGDALGMPTQTLTADEIRAAYGRVEAFVAPAPDHPVARGLPAGAVTDDTEQTLLLAHVLLASGDGFDHDAWVSALLDWEEGVKARGLHDLLGPSTKRALLAIAGGTPPVQAGRSGDTNGAAMRIAPAGIATPAAPLEALVTRVADTCCATHNTADGISAAAAVAATISAGVEGAEWESATQLGIAAAQLAARHHGGGDMGALIARATATGSRLSGDDEAGAAICATFGNGVAAKESVPAAFAVLHAAQGDAWRAAVIAANMGGDTDTIGAIAAGMAGAACGAEMLPRDRVAELRGIEIAELYGLVRGLLAARDGAA